jgi:hypothetical protein
MLRFILQNHTIVHYEVMIMNDELDRKEAVVYFKVLSRQFIGRDIIYHGQEKRGYQLYDGIERCDALHGAPASRY